MTVARNDLALAVLRVALGLAFVVHGWPKIQHPGSWAVHALPAAPPFVAAIAAVIEFAGGLAILAGFGTRIAGFFIAADMVVAIFFALVPRGASYISEKSGAVTFELPLIYLAVAFALVLIGPGALSIDGWRARRTGSSGKTGARGGRRSR